MVDVIFYDDRRGREPVREYLDALLASGRKTDVATIGRIVALLEEHGWDLRRYGTRQTFLIDKEARIYELRAGDHRVAYAEHQGRFVLLHAWRKSTRKLSSKELRTTRLRLDDWRQRHP